jgi:hypothetical protein
VEIRQVRVGIAAVLLSAASFVYLYLSATPRDRFDVNDSWSANESTNVLIGSYPIETSGDGKYVWVGSTASIALPFTVAAKSLNISGWIPFDQHRDRNHVTELVIGVSAGGRKLGDMRFDKADKFNRSFSLAGVTADRDGNLVVELTSSSVLPPTQTDQRSLSFTINKIWLE